MKIRHQSEAGRRPRIKATEVLRSSEPESFSVHALLTPEEWEEARNTIYNRENKNFGYVQDRYFLAFGEGRMDDLERDGEELFNIGQAWINDLADFTGAIRTNTNTHQLFHCMALLAKAIPSRREGIPKLQELKTFIRSAPGFVFYIDQHHKPEVGLRIMLRQAFEYLSLFPEDREWALEQLNKKISSKKIQGLLEGLIAQGNWSEYAKLAANARLLFPDQITTGHLPEIATWFKSAKAGHEGIEYTMLPDLLDIRILAANEARLGSDGQIELVEQTALSTQKPLPERLVA